MNNNNKLERLSLASLSQLVLTLASKGVSSLSSYSGVSDLGGHLALPANIRRDCKSFPGTNALAYLAEEGKKV